MRHVQRRGMPAAVLGLIAVCSMATQRITTAPATTNLAGACDGSAIVAVGDGYVLDGSDEDNTIRLYGPASTKATRVWDLDAFLQTERNKRGFAKEADLEAGTRLGTRVYWIGSHGNDKDGNRESSRHRFFATEVTGRGAATDMRVVGTPARNLLDGLLKEPSAVGKALTAASAARHQRGGLDIEGLVASSRDTILIGFRSPLIDGKAILVELLNPDGAATRGESPRFAAPMLVDFDGLGVRDMSPGEGADEVLVLAGPPGPSGPYAIYKWTRGEPRGRLVNRSLPSGVVWEGLAREGARNTLLLTADDGDVGNPACKDRSAGERSFRVWRDVP
ncbi:MAG: DUF3616 domain-containing protein [Vicinamibacterales bacterium]